MTVLLACGQCGRLLDGDPDDEPDGEGPGRHLCGECRRAREFDDLFLIDVAADDEVDGR